jgi:hypothetical protein
LGAFSFEMAVDLGLRINQSSIVNNERDAPNDF